ncbi:MAG: type III-B CRISPR module RAMP protein Cmr4 [Bacteroidetes bacterium]|nr:type III-B CRISPR module RAMP protein Cmr4 [Bacteroidota bacterium]
MNYSFYKIKTLANLHVGSGQNSYGIVDNIVQRDYINDLPTIYSSSLKGALKEWISAGLNQDAMANQLFGSDGVSNNSDGNQGSHYIHAAYLMSYPMRSDSCYFFNTTTPQLAKELLDHLNQSGIDTYNEALKSICGLNPAINSPISLNKHSGAVVEKHSIKTIASVINPTVALNELLGDNILVMEHTQFKLLCKRLPIITRNQLENGVSKNLFYEEVVPRETRFGFLVGAYNNEFDGIIANTDAIVQIGANATIGYGFCKLQKI